MNKDEVINGFIWLSNQIETYSRFDNKEYATQKVKESKEKFSQHMAENIDFNHLTDDDCDFLGFGRYEEIRLIPIYLLPSLPDGIEVTSILGYKKVYDKVAQNLDYDTRGGLLAFGIKTIKGRK